MTFVPIRVHASVARTLTLACLLTMAGTVIRAQDIANGRITGVVTDRTGAAIAAATVELRAAVAAPPVTTTSGADGSFVFESVTPGRHIVAVLAPGFESSVRQVLVAAHSVSVASMTLDIARRMVTVEVTAPAAARPLVIETDPRTPRQPLPAHDGADYLKTIPGFSVIRKGGTDGDPVLRGMAGSRLGILLDGESVLGGCGNRMDPPTAYAFPGAYDRITVLKGPQTVLHGPGNSAGVVLFERDRSAGAQQGVHLYASPTFGSFGRNDQAAEVKVGTTQAYVQVSATRTAMSDYVDGSDAEVHSRYERWSTNGALGWTPDAATRLEVSGALSDGEAAYADRAMDGVAFSRQNLGLRLERRNISAAIQNVEGQAYYNYVDHVMDNYSLRQFTASMMMPNPAVSNPDRRTVGGRVSSGLQVGASTRATVGVDWQGNRHALRSSSNQSADPYDAKARTRDASFDNVGVYGEVTRAMGASARLVAGARIDWWTGRDARTTISTAGTAFANPTAGLERRDTFISGFGRYEHALASGITLYAGVGHVERAPDFWELVSKESTQSLSAFETRPEQTTQLDTGVLYRSGPVSGSLSVFVNGIRDYILVQSNYAKTATTGGMGMTTTTRKVTVSRNIDTSMLGGEATLAWAITPVFTVDTSVAYTRGTNDTDGLPLAQQPPLEARVGLQYTGARWALGALTRLVAEQDRYALNQGNIVGQDLGPTSRFAVVSLNGSWRASKLIGVSAGVDNLLDATYAEFISRSGANVPGFTTTTRVNEPGRTAWIKLDLRR